MSYIKLNAFFWVPDFILVTPICVFFNLVWKNSISPVEITILGIQICLLGNSAGQHQLCGPFPNKHV